MARLAEFQGKQLLREVGVAVPRGERAGSAADAVRLAERLGGAVVVKAQAWTTGRKGQGLVRFAAQGIVDLWEQKGTMIEYGMRQMDTVTGASLTGGAGDYAIYAAKFRSRGLPLDEFNARGRGFLAHLEAEMGGEALLDVMFDSAMDHHLMLQEGDGVPALRDLADAWGIGFVEVGA